MTTWRSASLAAAAAALLVLTTACGQEDRGGGDTGGDTGGGQPVGAAQPARPGSGGYGDYGSGGTTAPGTGAGPAGRLAVWDSPALGRVLTDSAGFTLYRFDEDSASPPRSRCEGDCAKAWPVVAAEGATAPPGTDAALLGEVARPDGVRQLTVAGRPVYRYAKDTRAGEAKGQGVGGTWFAAAPDGGKAGVKAGGAAAGNGGTGGYGTGGGRSDGSGSGSGPAEPASPPGLATRKDPKLGEIVVDREGMTVYRFLKDSAWPMRTACTGECLEK